MFQLCFLIITLLTITEVFGNFHCGLDPKINADTWESYLDEIGFIFGSACGRNRGIFVTDPPDGHTYNCAHFPLLWNVTDANSIKQLKNYDDAVNILDKFISSVYFSTPEYVRKQDPGACDFEAMSSLTCGNELPWQRAPWVEKLNHSPIRAVNIGGLFVLQRYITPSLVSWEELNIHDQLSFSLKCSELSICQKLHDHWNNFYSFDDFLQMKSLGLNSIRIPLGYWYFDEISGISTPYLKPTNSIHDINHPITKIISWAREADLQVILVLESIKDDVDIIDATSKASSAIAQYIYDIKDKFNLDNVMLLEIDSIEVVDILQVFESSLNSIRSKFPLLPLMYLESLTTQVAYKKDLNVFINTKVYHGTSISDVASDTSFGDREKMYAHEKIACGFKAPLHFTTCKSNSGGMVGEFSLAIDNCLAFVDKNFENFGQCDHIEERIDSPWWKRHYQSFAMRQISTYERELGWAFMTWKLDDDVENLSSISASLWSFRKAVALELINLNSHEDMCAHAPAPDYILGDATLSPTSLPTYWIPPVQEINPENPVSDNTEDTNVKANSIYRYASIAVMSLLGIFVLYIIFYNCIYQSRGGYSTIPNIEMNQRDTV